MLDGIFIVDKPARMTSRALVNRVQLLLPRGVKIGHTGTLDPLATGVLVLCVGTATKQAETIQSLGKTYRAGIRLGGRSTTDDADGIITVAANVAIPDPARIDRELQGFVGRVEQRPPQYSAIKVGGRRAYAMARKGQRFDLSPRWVQIDSIQRLEYVWPLLELMIECGKGTYIRSLARDLGERLGVGGYIESLRRIRVGPFAIDQAVKFSGNIAEDQESLRTGFIPIAQALAMMTPRTTS